MRTIIKLITRFNLYRIRKRDQHCEELIDLLAITIIPIKFAIFNVFFASFISYKIDYWDYKNAFYMVILLSIVENLLYKKVLYKLDFIIITFIYSILFFFISGMFFFIIINILAN
jgi:hypothetical protein